MSRRELIRHLESRGCYLLREGGNHSIYVNAASNRTTSVPRHRDLNDYLARKIYRDLGIPDP